MCLVGDGGEYGLRVMISKGAEARKAPFRGLREQVPLVSAHASLPSLDKFNKRAVYVIVYLSPFTFQALGMPHTLWRGDISDPCMDLTPKDGQPRTSDICYILGLARGVSNCPPLLAQEYTK